MPRSGSSGIVQPAGAWRCFNEAGAIMPRSGVPRRRVLCCGYECFNEAGAIMPRSGLELPHGGRETIVLQ